MERTRAWLGGFWPTRVVMTRRDQARGVLGALAGIGVAGAVGRGLGWGPEALPWLVAPLGASAVLLFVVPASPLAQPWSIMGGNVSAALVGVAVERAIADRVVAAAVAVATAIAVTMVLGCVHPPAGAVALTVVLGPPAVQEAGWSFAVWPVGVNSACLLAVALAVNNASGLRYPRPRPAPSTAVERDPAGVEQADIQAALVRRGGGHDVAPAELAEVVGEARAIALERRLGGLVVGDLMDPAPAVLAPGDSAYRARVVMNAQALKALPVVDPEQRVLGILTMADLFNLDPGDLTPVSELMSRAPVQIDAAAPLTDLIASMVGSGRRHLPVVAGGRLVGLVGRVQLIEALHHELLAEGP